MISFHPSLLFSRQWRWATLLVVTALFLFVRLGVWQLDRLQQRQAANAELAAQLAQPAVNLNQSLTDFNANDLRYRSVQVTGIFDISQQLLLSQQRYQGRLGYHLLAPLQIAGTTQAVLVDRGWIPASAEQWLDYPNFPITTTVTIQGYIQETEKAPNANPSLENPQKEWFQVDIAAIQKQLPYSLLPFYIWQQPDSREIPTTPPYLTPITFDLSEGSHLGYAIQWFLFALILGGGYIYYIDQNHNRDAK